MPTIESPQNSLYKKLLSLTKSKGVKQENQALVSGGKITQEMSHLNIPSFWIITEKMTEPKSAGSRTVTLSDSLFNELDVCGTQSPLLCVDTPPIGSFADVDQNKAILFAALSDPTNLGALIRTCAAFDWPQIVLLKESANPYLPKAIRAASGTSFTTALFNGPGIDELKDPDIMALDMQGQKLQSSLIKQNLKLLVGEEGQGVPKSFPGQRVTIPISNKVESLNATIATSLLVYEWSKV